jgi:glycosyltransferase involved in cell wall biosynthesis
MDFSVVVPIFNAEPHLDRCITALLEQTVPVGRYELLMVDNNSSDASPAIVCRYSRVRLLHEAEQGSYAARNRGVRNASGEIVAFTDPDCVPHRDWLEQIERAMASAGTLLVLGDREFATDSGVLGALAAYESAVCAYIHGHRRVESYYAYTNNMAVRMSVLQQLGGFEQLARGADTLFLRRVISTYGADTVKYAPEMIVRHLEIASTGDYFEKKGAYGRVNGDPKLRLAVPVPLSTRVRLALGVLRRRRPNPAAAAGFLAALAAGALQFDWQRRTTDRQRR